MTFMNPSSLFHRNLSCLVFVRKQVNLGYLYYSLLQAATQQASGWSESPSSEGSSYPRS